MDACFRQPLVIPKQQNERIQFLNLLQNLNDNHFEEGAHKKKFIQLTDWPVLSILLRKHNENCSTT